MVQGEFKQYSIVEVRIWSSIHYTVLLTREPDHFSAQTVTKTGAHYIKHGYTSTDAHRRDAPAAQTKLFARMCYAHASSQCVQRVPKQRC